MTLDGSTFPEPPRVYEARTIDAWLASVARATRLSKMEAYKDESSGRLENLEIGLDVDATRTRVQPSDGFVHHLRELTGRGQFEPHFELPAVAELLLRAMAEGGYHSVTRVVVDQEKAHDNAARPKDVRGAVELLTEASHRAARCEAITLEVLDDENGDSPATVTVRRVAKRQQHAIGVRFTGEVREENFRAFLSYLTQHFNRTYVAPA